MAVPSLPHLSNQSVQASSSNMEKATVGSWDIGPEEQKGQLCSVQWHAGRSLFGQTTSSAISLTKAGSSICPSTKYMEESS